MNKPMNPLLMTALAREYWAASRHPDEPASKAFFESQSNRDYWPRLSDLCFARVLDYSKTASTSFSDGISA
jgi:hypothetical protein